MPPGPSLLAAVFAGANLLLLAALATVWLGNYRQFRSRHVLALVCFSLLLAVENAAALAFHLSMHMLYADAPAALLVAPALRGVQCLALCFLTWATVR